MGDGSHSSPRPVVTKRRAFLALLLAIVAALSPPARAADPPVLLVVGDSISAGYGLAPGTGWVSLLAERIAAKKLAWHVVNASISGDTTAGGRARFPALLAQYRPAVAVIELGGNDGLRGGALSAARDNLDAMVVAAQHAGAKVLIIGMRLPPNYGPGYTREFQEIFPAVAKARHAALVPFFFETIADDDANFQADRIHPAAAAQPALLDIVWPQLAALLRVK